jgi:hypothetical protein
MTNDGENFLVRVRRCRHLGCLSRGEMVVPNAGWKMGADSPPPKIFAPEAILSVMFALVWFRGCSSMLRAQSVLWFGRVQDAGRCDGREWIF